jgi:membrane protease YdiL (CAAX protease family)
VGHPCQVHAVRLGVRLAQALCGLVYAVMRDDADSVFAPTIAHAAGNAIVPFQSSDTLGRAHAAVSPI